MVNCPDPPIGCLSAKADEPSSELSNSQHLDESLVMTLEVYESTSISSAISHAEGDAHSRTINEKPYAIVAVSDLTSDSPVRNDAESDAHSRRCIRTLMFQARAQVYPGYYESFKHQRAGVLTVCRLALSGGAIII